MARTESISFQVHPNDEQEQINLMQKFCWNLMGSQEIKTIDNHLERRGDDIYQVSSTEHYIKLVFNRDLETPNLKEIHEIEDDFFSMKPPVFPALFPSGIVIWLLGFLFCFPGVGIAWPLYYFLSYKPKTKAATMLAEQQAIKQQELLSRLEQYT